MSTFPKVLDFLALGTLVALPLTSACATGTTNAVRSSVPAPGAAADQAVQPLVARQFAPVADAEWTPDKPLVGREIDCENGKAKIFDCKDVSLLAFLPESLIGGPQFTALKGWTDPASGREFVVAGRAGGTSFVEISDPLNPRYLYRPGAGR